LTNRDVVRELSVSLKKGTFRGKINNKGKNLLASLPQWVYQEPESERWFSIDLYHSLREIQNLEHKFGKNAANRPDVNC
jgi:hypothetical protein